MFKILTFIGILLLTINSSAQDCQYEYYFHLTDLAKEQVSKKKFKEAKRSFKEAFSNIEFPLGHDLSFALYVADQTKDNEWAELIAEKLAMGGVPLRYFSKFKKRKWYSDFETEFKVYNKYYDKNFNSELRNQFLALSKKDTEFNENYHAWRKGNLQLSLQDLIDQATEIVTEFNRINDKYGFPDEQKMGYYYVPGKIRVEPFPVLPLLVHIYQRGVLVLQEEIHTIVCKGGLHPSYELTLQKVRGFGNSTGVEQEMQARYAKYQN